MNSLVIVLFLSGMVAMIMLRTLHKDIARYNQMDNSVSTKQALSQILAHTNNGCMVLVSTSNLLLLAYVTRYISN